MVVITCIVPDYTFRTDNVSEALPIALLSNHALAKQNLSRTTQTLTATRRPKLERSKIDVEVTVGEWNVFKRCWEVFRTGSSISDSSTSSQLFQCAGTQLGDSLLKANPNAATESLPRLLAATRSLAAIPPPLAWCARNSCRYSRSLMSLLEPSLLKYGAKQKPAPTPICTYGTLVDYIDHVIRDVILNGLYDTDIKREVLGALGILEKPLNDVIALVESKDTFSLLPPYPLSLTSRNKWNFYQTPTLSPPRQIGPKRWYASAATMPSRFTQKGREAGTRDPTKHKSIATGPIAVRITHSYPRSMLRESSTMAFQHLPLLMLHTRAQSEE